MKLLAFLFRTALFVALTFVFLVLFQYGTPDFAANARTELNYWLAKAGKSTSEN